MESLWGRWQHVGLVLHTPQHDKRAPTRTCILQGHGDESERSVMHEPFDVHMASIAIQTTGKESTDSMRSKRPKQPRENTPTRVPGGSPLQSLEPDDHSMQHNMQAYTYKTYLGEACMYI